ncbi:MAG TPA: hypothetical protein VK203_07530 [Nostocaceae cyanobacterium]|nr:hypothetical protein [Nostocaceae cyanobacterium]
MNNQGLIKNLFLLLSDTEAIASVASSNFLTFLSRFRLNALQ